MSVLLHFWRYNSQRSEEFPTVTEAIAVALKWKHAAECWGIAYSVSKDGVDLFPEMEEPEQWASAWDRQAGLGATLFKERLRQGANQDCCRCLKAEGVEQGAYGDWYCRPCWKYVTTEGMP